VGDFVQQYIGHLVAVIKFDKMARQADLLVSELTRTATRDGMIELETPVD
jgi:hypothetical protein